MSTRDLPGGGFEVSVNFQAQTEEAESKIQRLRNLITGPFKRAQGELTTGISGTEEESKKLASSFGRMSGLLAQASIITFVTAIGFRQLSVAQERVRDAQYRLNQVIEKYGTGSKEAGEAQRNLSMATRNLQWAQAQLALQLFLTGLQVIALTGKYLALAAAKALALGPLGILGVGLGIAGVIGFGAVMIGGMTVNIRGTTEEEIMSQYDLAQGRARRGVVRAFRGEG